MTGFSEECLAILALLRDRHNILISGAPGTGKSRLLNEVARAFQVVPSSGPVHVPGAKVSIPATPPVVIKQSEAPSPKRKTRRVFRTVFHQSSKYRDFISGLVPEIDPKAVGQTRFAVTEGTMFRASEHAKSPDGASLLIIDEINRGPAVQVFGGSIVAIESDKRLLPDGGVGPETQSFELLAPTGRTEEYALPHHLYLLAAMNQADTSVEPLDVAFLRRWAPWKLEPSIAPLLSYFKITAAAVNTLKEAPVASGDVFAALVRAWSSVNARVALGRGREFQIGHGVLMVGGSTLPGDLSGALRVAGEAWRMVRAHVDEVFFGDIRGVAAVLGISDAKKSHPYKLEDRSFADEPRLEIAGPDPIPADQLYTLLRSVGED